MSTDNGATWDVAATTSTPMYVTYSEPQGPMFRTVLHVGTVAAEALADGIIDGSKGDDDVLAAVWAEFADRDVKTWNGSSPLGYYQPFTNVTNLQPLLTTGNGQCNSWNTFFYSVLRDQGLSGGDRIKVTARTDYSEFGIKNVATLNGPIPVAMVVRLTGLAGQGGATPAAFKFDKHFITKVGTRYYDPSYGTSFDTFDDWRQASLAFVVKMTSGTQFAYPFVDPDTIVENAASW